MSKQFGIARVMSDALDQVANVGKNVVTTICGAVSKVYKGAEIPKDDVESIVNELAVLRGWSDAESRVRKSEARTILATYSELPAAAAKLADKGKGNWKDAVTLARKLKSGETVSKAIAAMTTEHAKKKPSAKAAAKVLLNRVLKLKKLDASFLRGVEQLIEKL